MVSRQKAGQVADKCAEAETAAKRDRQRQIGLFASMIGDQLRLTDLRKGKTALAKFGIQPGAAQDDSVAIDRIAAGNAERTAQCGQIGPALGKFPHIDRPDCISRTGEDLETDFGIRAIADRLDHFGIEVAIASQQLPQQCPVAARTGSKLGRIVVAFARQPLDGRKRGKAERQCLMHRQADGVGRHHQQCPPGNAQLLAFHPPRSWCARFICEEFSQIGVGRQIRQFGKCQALIRPGQTKISVSCKR